MQVKMKGKIFNSQEVQDIIADKKTQFREVLKVQPVNENQVFSTVVSSIRNKDIGTHNFINPEATWEQTKKFKCPYQIGQKIFVKESWVLVEDHLDYETGGEWSVREWEGSLEEAQAHLNGDARFGLKASVYYPADGEDENPSGMHDCIGFKGELLREKEIPWRSARSMPEWASRLTLEVVNIKVERLDDITEEDCLKEGVSCHVGSEIADTGDYFDNEYWFGDLEEFKCNNCNTSGMDIGGCDECRHAQPHTNTFTNAYDPFMNYWNAIHKKSEEKFEAYPFVWVVDFKIIN